jgi:hypothetical protein
MADKIVAPMVHPNPVQPMTSGDFHLSDCEIFLFDGIASEVTNIAGTEVDLFQFNKKKSTRDPLYDETIKDSFDGPFRLRAWVEWPDPTPETRAEGFRKTFPATMWLARVDLEVIGASAPSFGDIVRFWNTPYFNGTSTSYQVGSNVKGYYFTLTEVKDDGHLFDNPSFVGFKCTIARNTEFAPERRVHNA